jgi:transcriptional regulator with GAF, ATPase, and Fis domain
MRRWRVFGVDDQKAVQLREAFDRYLTTRDADNFGIEERPDVPLTVGDVPTALRTIADAPVPFDCIVIDVDLSRHRDRRVELPRPLHAFNKPYGTWIGRYIIQAGLPTELLYYSEAHAVLLAGFDLPSLGVRFVPGVQWETLCDRVLEVLEQRQGALLNGSVEGRMRLTELLGLIGGIDANDAGAVRAFLARTFTLPGPNGEADEWRCGDFFLAAAIALARNGAPAAAAAALQRLRRTLGELEAEGGTTYASVTDVEECGGLIARSRSMKAVFSTIRQVAAAHVSVLIEGETGTGKELVAREIHRRSGRGDHRFVAVNCSAIPAELIESELFGAEKGAFTGATERKIGRFEQADRGTVFLDEIGEMSLAAQVKVLRALQEREIDRLGATEPVKIDVRVIAATNKPLRRGIKEGWFREDLFHRLCVIPISVPPLRDRPEDIGPIAARYIRRQFEKMKKVDARTGAPLQLAEEDVTLLEGTRWTGNVRELENVLEAAWVLAADGQPLGSSLGLVLAQRVGADDVPSSTLAVDRAAIWARIKQGQAPVQTLGDLETEFGQFVTVDVARLALDEYSMSDAAGLFGMTYRNFEQWLRRRGYVKGTPRRRDAGV